MRATELLVQKRIALFTALVCAPLLLAKGAHAQTPDVVHRLVANVDAAETTINKHIYGHFAEHLGRDIYGGFWIRGEDGEWEFNEPVIEALRQIDPPNVRWPGGCFADYYHWRDGVGPQEARPTIVNNLWGGVTEDNSFGTHEFMRLVEQLDAEPIVVGNVGTLAGFALTYGTFADDVRTAEAAGSLR